MLPTALPAQEYRFPNAEAAPAPAVRFELSAGASHHRLTNGFGEWDGVSLQLRFTPSPATQLIGALERARRFDEHGELASLQWLQDLSPRLQTQFALAGTSGGTFWPASQWRVGAGWRWLEARNLVTFLSIGRNVSRVDFRDRLIEASVAWYTPMNWVAQAGVRRNVSSPGDVDSDRAFVALTWSRPNRYEWTLRADSGREGYQPTLGTSRMDFRSHEAELGTKLWLGANTAIQFRANHYRNPFYRRNGGSLAVVFGF